jgi:hypothetical protein
MSLMLFSILLVLMNSTTNQLWLVLSGVFEANLKMAEPRKQGILIKIQEQSFQILTLILEKPRERASRVK